MHSMVFLGILRLPVAILGILDIRELLNFSGFTKNGVFSLYPGQTVLGTTWNYSVVTTVSCPEVILDGFMLYRN